MTEAISIEALGFTQEELQERVVERICEQVLRGVSWDEDGSEFDTDSMFRRKLDKDIRERVDATLGKLFEKHMAPNVEAFIEGLVLVKTNTWGEKRGESVTFIEYLTERAGAYLSEDVDYQGRSQAEARRRGNSWSGRGTSRIVHLIDAHLDHSIKTAMADALKIVNNQLADGLAKTAKAKLQEISKSLKLTVKVR